MNGFAFELLRATIPTDSDGKNLSVVDWNSYAHEDLEEFGRLLEINRYGGHLLRFARLSNSSLPKVLLRNLDVYQRKTLFLNAMYLKTVRHLNSLMKGSGIDIFIFKGVVAQNEVYSDCFVKHTTDVDLFVRPRDYSHVRSILIKAGFCLAPGCESFWWTYFLGEQHFRFPDSSFMAVDLHHRVDQPGGPQPRLKTYFLEASVPRKIGPDQVLTLGPIQNALFNALSLAKAYLHREPCGKYLVDLHTAFVAFDDLEWAKLAAFARNQNLLQTLAFAVEAVEVVFGAWPSRGRLPRSRAVALVPAECFVDSLLDPDAAGIRRPSRLHTLIALCDTPVQMASAVIRKLASESWHWAFESRRGRRIEA